LTGSENALLYLLQGLKHSHTDIPKLFQCCGTEDFLYGFNTQFRDYARQLGVDLTYEEGPGAHTWEYWDTNIQQ
jgi:putative tributyrin esterase